MGWKDTSFCSPLHSSGQTLDVRILLDAKVPKNQKQILIRKIVCRGVKKLFQEKGEGINGGSPDLLEAQTREMA